MFQYRAVLQSTEEVIAEAHTLKQLMHSVIHFKRLQKVGEHTHANDKISIFHIQRDKLHGIGKPKLVKVV